MRKETFIFIFNFFVFMFSLTNTYPWNNKHSKHSVEFQNHLVVNFSSKYKVFILNWCTLYNHRILYFPTKHFFFLPLILWWKIRESSLCISLPWLSSHSNTSSCLPLTFRQWLWCYNYSLVFIFILFEIWFCCQSVQ